MNDELETFEDFQRKKKEYLARQKDIKEELEEDDENIVSYPEIFAYEKPIWITKV